MAATWQTITLKPLTGTFDARSRPEDLVAGTFRWKQNWAISDQGRLWRRDGFLRFGSSLVSDSHPFSNHDYHQQAQAPRQPVSRLYESTGPDGTRRLFACTQRAIALLDPVAGTWNTIWDNQGTAGSTFQCATLVNHVLFTNDHNAVLCYRLDTGAIGNTGNLTTGGGAAFPQVTKALVAAEFAGFILLMNVHSQGARHTNRIVWCDMNDASVWNASPTVTLAGYQDIDSGEEILAAKQLGSFLMIYTTRSIWKLYVAAAADAPFGFTRVYTDPETRHACLAYRNAIVSDGISHYYMGRDGIYRYSPYTQQPERVQWIHDSSALIFSDDYPNHRVDADEPQMPVAFYRADRDELWFSWPAAAGGDTELGNKHTLCCNVRYKTCDYMDTGWTALGAFTPSGAESADTPLMVGASGEDWCLKEIGDAFAREYATMANNDPTGNITSATFYSEGYNSILRGEVPGGASHIEKCLRHILIAHDTAEQTSPCRVCLRTGNAYMPMDANQDGGTCGVQWRTQENRSLVCPNAKTMQVLAASNLKPDSALEWAVYEQNLRLYYELIVEGTTGPAIGADTAWSYLQFEVKAVA